jgi:competence protein ComEA
MSFYRFLAAGLVSAALIMPAFADDTSTTTTTTSGSSMSNPSSSTTTTTMTTKAKINLNTASVKDLMKVKGINASRARAIIAYRKQHGDFKSIEDLSNVKGFQNMKSNRLQQIQQQITIE